ncbi:MAG: 4-hydroxy-3-methylbut-2-enyl diphosphate reductase [Lentisphaerae bacterium]|nr:4-hydroxy-3-methylbut-2-enyl diphosphate reductase [Lentisphaerota bacterium]
MKVLVARSAGFCWGVRRAVETAERLGREGRVFTDGPLIHNRGVMQELAQRGIRTCTNPAALQDGACLLIRAHGIAPERRRTLQGLPLTLVDATCPDVARIQGTIRRYARRGCRILILGDPGHAEVVGLLGYAEGRGTVVTGPRDVEALAPAPGPVCLVSQSTQFTEDFDAVAAAVRRRFPAAETVNTICEATRNRQAELVDLARRTEAIVVVGDAHSANTMRLVALARRHGRTVHVEHAGQIDPATLRDCRTVGLTAGASTPAGVIEAVRKRLESF